MQQQCSRSPDSYSRGMFIALDGKDSYVVGLLTE